MSDSTKHLGISQPVSTAFPTSQDIRLSESLEMCLKSFDIFESPLDLQKRADVLLTVHVLLQEWVKKETKLKLSNEDSDAFGGKLCTFGSYRLGVHNRGADIDCLCVVPRHIDRKDFFGTFLNVLKKNPAVTDLRAISDAFVPVIKLRFVGIELDLLFARVADKTVPETYSVSNDCILKNVDDFTIRSLNGCRVAEEILAAVPNQETFLSCLRAVKHWANVRGVYSNTLGFFGGVTYAILVARICQLYPNAAPARLFHKFFYVYSKWKWPTPVLLNHINSCPVGFEGMKEKVWDPRVNKGDKLHLMPVITPAFPQQNSTFNVSKSTKAFIEQEIKAGLEIIESVILGQSPWATIFEETNFFTRYRHFIVISIVCNTKDDHLIFSSLVESKVRCFVGYLDRNKDITLAHINPKKFKPLTTAPIECYNEYVEYCAHIENIQGQGKVDLTSETKWFIELLVSCQKESHKNNKVDVKYVHQKEIKKYIAKDDMLKGKRHQRKKPLICKEPLLEKAGDKRKLTRSVSTNDEQRPENDPPEDKKTG